MRLNLLSSTVLCFLAGLSLFVGTEQTDRFSAWTINSAITAAFIGAAYWGPGVFLTLLSALQRDWARARIAVPATFVFGILGLVSTIIHLDRFHLNSDDPWTRALTYLWLVPYGVGWLISLVVLVHQLRVPGGDPPPEGAFPSWLRVVLGIQAGVLLLVGVMLFAAPQLSTSIWPWELTPLTARVVGAWLIGIGVGAAHVAWENDWGRVFAAAVCYTLFGALELVVLARYPGAVDWGSPQVWVYLLFMLSVMAVGLYVWLRARRGYSLRPQTQTPVAPVT
jgi:hypothetical protein